MGATREELLVIERRIDAAIPVGDELIGFSIRVPATPISNREAMCLIGKVLDQRKVPLVDTDDGSRPAAVEQTGLATGSFVKDGRSGNLEVLNASHRSEHLLYVTLYVVSRLRLVTDETAAAPAGITLGNMDEVSEHQLVAT